MNLNPLFLNKLNSADNAQVIAFPKLESQQFLFSNIIKVYEEDIEIPQSTQNLFADEKPDLLISELSQILSSLENDNNLAVNEEQSEVPKLVTEKEIADKEFIFDKTTVKELINKIRQLLDANKDLTLEVKKIPLNTNLQIEANSPNEVELPVSKASNEITAPVYNFSKELTLPEDGSYEEINITKVDSKPEYSFEIKIKTEAKEVLVTIIPTSFNRNQFVESPVVVTASIPNSESDLSINKPLVVNSEFVSPASKYSVPNSGTIIINNKSEVENNNYYPSESETLILKEENGFKENGVNKTKSQILNTKVSVNQQTDSAPSKPESIDSEVNTKPSEPVATELVETDTFLNIDEEGNGYFEAPLKQSKKSPIELTMPKKHFSVRVQESSEKINLESIQKVTNKVETELLNSKLPAEVETIKDFEQSEKIPSPQSTSKTTEINSNAEKTDVKENITFKIKEANNLVEPKSKVSKSSVGSENKEDIKTINVPANESKTSATGLESKDEKVVIPNVLESKEEKSTNNIAQPKVTKEAIATAKPAGPMENNVKIQGAGESEVEIIAPIKETAKTENATPVKEPVKGEIPTPIKNTITAEKTKTSRETSTLIKDSPLQDVLSIENENTSKDLESVKKNVLNKEVPIEKNTEIVNSSIDDFETVKNSSPVKTKETVEVNKISDTISTEKVKYSKDIEESIPVEKNLSSNKEVESKEVKNVIQEKDYKVKIEVKNIIESSAPKEDKAINKPAKEFEIFEISGMMKSIKSDSNKDNKTEDPIKIEKENTIANTKKVAESESKADTGTKNEFSDKNLQQFTKNSTIDRVEAPKEKIFSELHNMQDSIRLIKSNEIVKEINKILARPETQSMTFQVTPDELGKIKLVIDLIENRVSAKIEVESEQVRQIVQNNIEQLKSSIQSSGVQVSSLNVSLNYSEQKAYKNLNSKKKNSLNENNFEIEDAKEDNSRRKMGYSTVEFLA